MSQGDDGTGAKKNELDIEIGARLSEARRIHGYSIEATAEKAKMLPVTILAIESGGRRATPTELLAILEIYGLSIRWVFDNAVVQTGRSGLAEREYVEDGAPATVLPFPKMPKREDPSSG